MPVNGQQSILSLQKVSISFGGLKVVENLDLEIFRGQLVGLIGPNGAGKTTVFNLITGVYQPQSGKIYFNGKSVVGLKPFEICRLGLARTFQNIRLFKDLSAVDNVLIAAHQLCDYNLFGGVVISKAFLKFEADQHKKAKELLNLFGLEKWMDAKAGDLPYGEQRKLEIVRALATNPKMILLDEPAAGMNHAETEGLMNLIARIRKEFALTVLLIEHDMKLVMGICEQIFVLDHGQFIAQGGPQQIQNHPRVIEAYLGAEDV